MPAFNFCPSCAAPLVDASSMVSRGAHAAQAAASFTTTIPTPVVAAIVEHEGQSCSRATAPGRAASTD